MPCVLLNASDKELEDYQLSCSQNDLPSLFVYYMCGFVPLGIFPATVANFFRQIIDKVCFLQFAPLFQLSHWIVRNVGCWFHEKIGNTWKIL